MENQFTPEKVRDVFRTQYIVNAILIACIGNFYMTIAAASWPQNNLDSQTARAQGQLYSLVSNGEPDLGYYFYLPATKVVPSNVIVSVHGISRNIDEHIWAMRSWADKYGVALIMPLYDKMDFHDYQRLGRNGHGPRADIPLIRILNEVEENFGINTQKIDLFGFSGGAQFSHRFSLLHPQRVSRLGIASAGWYTWPDNRQAYPMGTANTLGLQNAEIDLEGMLQIPTCIFVGERDTKRSRSLNTSPQLDKTQGENRLQRAKNWANAMQQAASDRGINASMQLEILPNTKHSFRQAVTRGKLISRLFECFYET